MEKVSEFHEISKFGFTNLHYASCSDFGLEFSASSLFGRILLGGCARNKTGGGKRDVDKRGLRYSRVHLWAGGAAGAGGAALEGAALCWV